MSFLLTGSQWNCSSSSNKLYSGSSDGTVRLWDCHTGQCANVINLGGEVGSVCSEGPWVFVGLPNVVKVSIKLCNVLFQFCCCHFVFSSRCDLDLAC